MLYDFLEASWSKSFGLEKEAKSNQEGRCGVNSVADGWMVGPDHRSWSYDSSTINES